MNKMYSALAVISPLCCLKLLVKHLDLIQQFTLREVSLKYKGSFLGVSWAFFQPLMLLCVYTFVFSAVFEMKWGTGIPENKFSFAIALYVGILTFNIFGEVANSAPTLILSNKNYVTKVVFPLEILPIVKMLSVLVHSAFGMTITILGVLFLNHTLPWTIILLPVAWLPAIFFSLGCAYFLSAVGVFIRDIGVSVGVMVNMLFFLSPVFYPIEAVPKDLQIYCRINPIAIYIDDARRVILLGQPPDWPWYFGGLIVSFIIFSIGFISFMRGKKAFADVL